jgi:signal peptidase I
MNPKLKAKLMSLWRNWARPILAVVVVLGTVRGAMADWYVVPTASMMPTIVAGDRIFVNKLAYDLRLPFTHVRLARWADPCPGDIVIVSSPATGERLVKRVVGAPGDTIELRNDRLFVNGERVTGAPIGDAGSVAADVPRRDQFEFVSETLGGDEHTIMLTPGIPAMRSFAPVVVPDGQFFLMGDNRDQSGDSRLFGFVSRDRVYGRATRIILSLDAARYYWPRVGRFFQPLE